MNVTTVQSCVTTCIGVVCILRAQQADIHQPVSLASAFSQCHSTVSKGSRIVIEIATKGQIAYHCTVCPIDKQCACDTYPLMRRTVLNNTKVLPLALDCHTGSS